MSLSIGNVQLKNPFVAAPLAGVTDAAMRHILCEMGAALVYTEMVSAKGLVYNNRNTEELLGTEYDTVPVAYQLFGSEPEILSKVVQDLEARENAIIDINMGCPVPKVVKNGEGSALLKNLDLLYDVAKSMVDATTKPVTAKIRIGWDRDSIVSIEAAKALESAGVAAITVHGRTRMEFFGGHSDWSEIAKVKRAVGVPIIGNGDVFCAEDGLKMMDETGCDFVMVGRGMLGNPWIFRELEAAWKGKAITEAPTTAERRAVIIKHLDLICALKGEHRGVMEMRKQLGWYIKGVPGAATLRRQINDITEKGKLLELIERMR